jgi:murein DD-endopeptidase MepM/ murein hydrolase activator NlpD
MKSFLKIFVIFLLIFSASCKHKPAKIVNRSSVVYGKNNHLNNSGSINSANNHSSKKSLNSSGDEIIAKSGDTLYSISRQHNVALRDIISENNLSPPYAIKNGDRITIPKPRYHTVILGDTLYSISRLYNTHLDQIVALNNLTIPYSIKVGDRIRINKFNEEKQNIALKKPPIIKKETAEEPELIAKTLDKLNKFSWPIKGSIISKFGPKSGGLYNDGINILAKDGTDVKAAEDGVVAYVGNELKGYGNLVILKHGGGWITAYAHLKDTAVKRGEKVNQGQKIGRVGATGNVTSPQLYFGLRKGRDAVDPLNYLSKR